MLHTQKGGLKEALPSGAAEPPAASRVGLGIDAGGSNCRARLVDARGVVVGQGRSGPANARIGIEALYATLIETADEAIVEAGLSAEQRGAIRAGMGIAGILCVIVGILILSKSKPAAPPRVPTP